MVNSASGNVPSQRGNSSSKKKSDMCARYREILEMQDLSSTEIDVMRKNVGLLAQTICEHVWCKKVY